MRVTFHGVRGSTPCHGKDTQRYGGNTSCVSVDAPGEQPLVFDMGTGLRYFGHGMPHDGSFHGTCLLTHLHWDHTQGLPFFVPTLREGSRFDIYAPVQDDGRSVAEAFGSIIRPPMFPVELGALPGEFSFTAVTDDEFSIGGYEVTSRLVPHVGSTVGYRLSWKGRSVVYISDHQQPEDGSLTITDGVRELCEGADLLIHDAQYTTEEFAAKCNWGHCTVDYAVFVAATCRVKRLALYHHDPVHHDDMLDDMSACAAKIGKGLGVEVITAREGMVVDL